MRARAEAPPTPLGPGGRPLRGLRIPVALLSLANLAANGLIMLSDRAPGALRRLSTTVDAGVARAATAAGAARAAADARIPQSDVHVHLAVWASAALLVGLAAWSWRSLLVGAGAVFALSAGMEAAQGLYSATRSVQLADLAANALGVASGAAAAAFFAVCWRAGAGRRDRPGGRTLLRWLRVVGGGSR